VIDVKQLVKFICYAAGEFRTVITGDSIWNTESEDYLVPEKFKS